jgi:hypothetical protein
MNLINILNKPCFFAGIWCTTISLFCISNKHITFSTHKNSNLSQTITGTFQLNKNDFLYKDFIVFSVNHPEITLSQWESPHKSIAYYDPLFKNTKQIFNTTVTLSLTVTAQTPIDEPIHLYCSYYQRSAKKINSIIYPLFFNAPPEQHLTHDSLKGFVRNNKYEHASHYKISLIDKYFTAFLSQLTYIAHTYNQTHGAQCLLIIMLLILCIIPPYFFTKKIHISSQLNELAIITRETLCCVLIGYILYSIQFFIWMWAMSTLTTIYTFCVGIFYIKKSAKLQWSYLRTLCNLIGGILTGSSVLCLFKIIQQLNAVF